MNTDRRSSEQRGRLHEVVLHRLGEGVVVQARDGRIVECNPAAERILGLSLDQMAGRTSLDPRWAAVHPDGSSFPGDTHPAMVCLRTGEPVRNVVMGVYRPDDDYVWILINSEPISDFGPTGPAVVTSFTDITVEMDRSTQRLKATVDSMLDPHLLCQGVRDDQGRVVAVRVEEVNEAALKALGLPEEDVLGARFAASQQGHRGLVATWVGEVLDTGQPLKLDSVHVLDLWLDVRAVQVGEFVSLTWRDVTERVEAAERLAASERLFRTALESAVTGVGLVDLDGRFTTVNDALCRILGRPRDELIGLPMQETFTAPLLENTRAEHARLMAEPAAQVRLTGQLVRGDGSLVWVSFGVAAIPDAHGASIAFLVQADDISGERRAREQLAYQAFHDPLTDLHNRSWMLDALAKELDAAAADGARVAVLFMDLDNFKVVNDSLGHAAGDVILKEVAGRIRRILGPGDHAARFGGDEFVVVTPVRESREAELLADRLAEELAAEVAVDHHRIIPTASIGIAISDEDSSPENLLRDADAALYSAKDAGRARWQLFDAHMHAQALGRMSLEAQMRRGLEAGEFVVHYQPIVRLSDRAVVGREALVRWEHPERGLVPAGEFIPVAEASGLIVHLGERVLHQVVELLRTRPDLPGTTSINVSAMQLSMPGWLEMFMETVRGIDPRRLIVEVTETAVLALGDTTADDLGILRDMGMGIHVDDFGTGFSSISLLRELPVTGLKLDVSFTANLTPGDSPANALAAGLVGLAHGLHLQTVAEGIETEEQARLLTSQGWEVGQGYLFGRPAAL